MGNTESMATAEDYRMHNTPIKLPMPGPKELNDQFERVLASMGLPEDKMKVLTNYDNDKKWELICDQDKVLIKNPPHYYIQTLLSYLDPSLRDKRFRRRIANSTKTLRELEISLRTNHIGWVREFLNEENRGLDVLVDYLAFAQIAVIYGDLSHSRSAGILSSSRASTSTGDLSTSFENSPSIKRMSMASTMSRSRGSTLPNRRTIKKSREIIDRDDVHVCITCLRSIMNYQYGFDLVMAHPHCINEIALSLNNKSLRTKSLVLELLAAVCLVRGGHDIILRAFNNFKLACGEPRRWSRLMQYFKSETENIDFMVSCTQFINIVVHSVEDLNFRVHLQYEFSLLGLDEYLETLRSTESDRLKVQIQAYLDNMFDVSSLLEDSDLKTTALERVENLEDQLLSLNEKFQEQEYENMTKIVELEKQLSSNIKELTTVKPSSVPAHLNIPSPIYSRQLGSIIDSGTQTPEPQFSPELTQNSPNFNGVSPEIIVPIGLLPSTDGFAWTALTTATLPLLQANPGPLSSQSDGSLGRKSMVLVPAEIWQDLGKRTKLPTSPSLSSFTSTSTSGSSGFLTDSSFQWKVSNGGSIPRRFDTGSLEREATGSLPRRRKFNKKPKFYIDKDVEYKMQPQAPSKHGPGQNSRGQRSDSDFGHLHGLTSTLESSGLGSETHSHSMDDWSTSSGERSEKNSPVNLESSSAPSVHHPGRKKKKKHASRHQYPVLPKIDGSNKAPVSSQYFPEVDPLSRALPSLGENLPQIPNDDHDNFLENLPPPPPSLLFNKNLVLPPLGSILEDRFSRISQRSNSTISSSSGSSKYSSSDENLEPQFPSSTPRAPPQSRPKPPNYNLVANQTETLGTIYEESGKESPDAISKDRKAAMQKGTVVMNGHMSGKNLPPMSKLPAMPDEDEGSGIKVKTKDPLAGLNKISDSSVPPAPSIPSAPSGIGAMDIPPPPPPPPPSGIPAPPPLGMPNLPGSNKLPGGLKVKQRHQTKYRLPVLNWKALRPNQVEGTVFNELDDDAVLNEIDMDSFEEMFKTRAQDTESDRLRLQKLAEAQQKRGTSLIDVNRARNLSITLRKIDLNTDEICRAVYSYDLEALPLEYVEMLPKFIPNEIELRAFKQYEKEGKPFDTLASEDKFMWLFGRVERLQQRLNIMIFIGNFNDNILSLTPQLAAVIAASMSIKSSQKLKKVLEIILALGNYMNSSKRGAVYGFKLQSLDSLLDTKSTDKKQSLLHYIVSVIQTYYTDVQDFYQELRYVDRASKVSLDSILTDVGNIRRGMELSKREYETHQHPVLKEFLENSEGKAQKLYSDATTAQEAFKAVVGYFGETPKVMPPETFFPMVDRFIKSYMKAEKDLHDWKKVEAKRALKQSQQKKSRKKEHKSENQNNNAALVEEERAVRDLRTKQRKDRRMKESSDGLIEDNIHYIKSEPYRREDAVNRSFRKRNKGEHKRKPVSTML